MSVPTPKRRIRALLAAAAVTAVLTAGCTASDWSYDAPPAAGTQADAGPVKARNLVFVTDDAGQAVLIGTITASETVTLQGGVVTPETADGGRGESTPLVVSGEIPRDGTLQFDASNAMVEGAELLPGRLAEITLQFDDGTQLAMDVPVFSTEHEDFTGVFGS